MGCHHEVLDENPARSSKGGKRKSSRFLGWVGLCCAGFCLTGMPLLSLVLSGTGMAWPGHGWVTWSLLAFSLTTFGSSLALSYRHHRNWRPGLVALVGGGLLVASASHAAPGWSEWIGMILLLAAWAFDHRTHRGVHGQSQRTGDAEEHSLSKSEKEAIRGPR